MNLIDECSKSYAVVVVAAISLAAGEADIGAVRQEFGLCSRKSMPGIVQSYSSADIDEALSALGKPPPKAGDSGELVTEVNTQTVQLGRLRLARCASAHFPLGNLWLLLGDYHRLAANIDVLKVWREPGSGVALGSFMHLTHETLRMGDLPGLLSEYKQLVDP